MQKGIPVENTRFMKRAIELSEESMRLGGGPFGAVIVKDGKIIGEGMNRVVPLNDPTAHAEMLAITAAVGVLGAKYLTGCSLYVTVEPCVMCAGALGWSQISRIVFGAADEKRGFQRFAPAALHPKTEVISGVLEEECSKLVKSFFKKKR